MDTKQGLNIREYSRYSRYTMIDTPLDRKEKTITT